MKAKAIGAARENTPAKPLFNPLNSLSAIPERANKEASYPTPPPLSFQPHENNQVASKKAPKSGIFRGVQSAPVQTLESHSIFSIIKEISC
jgi:hypothetical protein